MPLAPIGKAATLCDLALRLMRNRLPDFMGWSGYPSIAAMHGNAQAFTFAAQADLSATLVYNEFGIEEDSAAADRKRQSTLQLLRNLKQQGAPIHALGMQSHIASNSAINATKLTAFMNAVAELGLKIFITELDVKDQTLPSDVATRDAGVAAQYHSFLTTVLTHPAVNTVIIWGLSDRLTWLSEQAPRNDGLPVVSCHWTISSSASRRGPRS
jgi:endo-1,4-beta-xylanase